MLVNAPIATDSSIRFGTLPHAVVAKDFEHGRHELWPTNSDLQQVFIFGKATDTAPVAAVVMLDEHAAARLDAVRNVWRRLIGRQTGQPVLPITAQQRRRFILMLRALDGVGRRASYRDLAATLLDPDVRYQSRREWITSSYRAQIIRLVRDSVRRMEGGYLDLLCGH